MSRNIPVCRTWQVTFTERVETDARQYRVRVIAPNKRFALWEAREQFYGAFMMPHPDYSEKVGLVRAPNMCRGGSR